MGQTVVFAFLILVSVLICVDGSGESGRNQLGGKKNPFTNAHTRIDMHIGGVGGVYFLAEPGELTVEVEKRDLNRRGSRTELRAILLGPDRRVLQEVTIPDDGKPKGSGIGPVQRARLSTLVAGKGVYALNITVSRDRYGREIAWGLRTNCPRYLIETSRGHKDARHQEPIVLLNPDKPASVCFVPPGGAFDVEVTGLPAGVEALPLYDAKDALVHTLKVRAGGKVSHTFPGDAHRSSVPWRLHLPKGQATVHIDGVTRWENNDPFPNLSYWSPDPGSWFPLREYRWLLTPYSRTVYGEPGKQGQVVFQVHNNSDRERTIQLRMEFPEGEWPARLSGGLAARRVVVGSKQAAEVTVGYTVPAGGGTRVCHVRVTPVDDRDFSTYSTLTLKRGVAPAARPLKMPIVLKPYRHENEQFGYLPDYPVGNQVYFDLQNQPFVRTRGSIEALRGGKWVTSAVRFGMPSAKVAFDREGDLYLIATTGRDGVLLHSTDRGKTFSAYKIPARKPRGRTFDIEQFSGHNVPDGPPPVLRYTQTARDPRRIWRRINDLELILAEKKGGRLSVGEPILISRKCIGLSAHSGIPSAVVSRGTKVHVAWGEATDPDEKVPGVPGYVVTYDRETRRLGEPVLVGYGAPPNDVHNSPSITMDSRGYLHVVVGTHGRPFQYARSLKPNDAHSGWTEAVPVGKGLRQTYIGLVCGPDDTLHLAFRLWRSGVDPFPLSHHATLAHQRKRPGRPWEAPEILIVPPFSEYSIFYHRLTIDRVGRLFLSYDYWSTFWFYRTDHFGRRRALLTSPDGGDTWKLAGHELGLALTEEGVSRSERSKARKPAAANGGATRQLKQQLRKARDLAARTEFDSAIAQAQKLIPMNESAKAALHAFLAGCEAGKKLKAIIIERAQEKTPTVRFRFGGQTVEATLVGADSSFVILNTAGGEGPMPWQKIKPLQFHKVAAAVTEDHELLSAYCVAMGLLRQASGGPASALKKKSEH